ncbi:MAG: ester cyclase [Chlamydiales bacterium]|nr:ester cyclase [Chlamydiales bacterium]
MKIICRLLTLILVTGVKALPAYTIMEDNIDLVRRLWDSPLTLESVTHYDDFTAEDIQIHGPQGEERQGLEAIKAIDSLFATAFKEISVEIQDIFGAEDRVIVYWRWRGAHVGMYKDIPASDKTITLIGMVMYRFDTTGKIAEVWASWDELSLYKQIAKVTIEPEWRTEPEILTPTKSHD